MTALVSPLARVRRLSPADRRLAFAALLYVTLARAAVALLGFHRLSSLLERSHPRSRRSSTPDRIAWAVAAAGRFVPGAACLAEAAAARLLLHRHGWPAILCLGVMQTPTEGFRAHAWIESSGRVLVGSTLRPGFVLLARIGDA